MHVPITASRLIWRGTLVTVDVLKIVKAMLEFTMEVQGDVQILTPLGTGIKLNNRVARYIVKASGHIDYIYIFKHNAK